MTDSPDLPAADADRSVPGSPGGVPAPDADRAPTDLQAIERDLDGVEAALRRLDDGSYWTDEVTGDAIPDTVLEADPVARRATDVA